MYVVFNISVMKEVYRQTDRRTDGQMVSVDTEMYTMAVRTRHLFPTTVRQSRLFVTLHLEMPRPKTISVILLSELS